MNGHRDLVAELQDIVGAEHVLTDDDLTQGYRVDWTGQFVADRAVVVRPADPHQVAGVVRACAAHGKTICTQGGNTGMVGAAVPVDGDVVVSTRRLTRLEPVDSRAATVVVGAGTTLAQLHDHVGPAGFIYGVDLGGRDSATVGGTIATNAGGNNVIRYGMTRDQLVGIEAVLADGTIVGDLSGLAKDNTGYDLPNLFCGSEGTLGIVTAATVRLHHRLPERVAALVGFETEPGAFEAVEQIISANLGLEAIEFMLGDGFDRVSKSFDLTQVLDRGYPAYLLVECAAMVSVTGRLAATIAELGGVGDAAIAEEATRRRDLWRFRELHTDAIRADGPTVKLDISVPLTELASFVADVRTRTVGAFPSCYVWLFGHVGDGNVHINVTGVPEPDRKGCGALILDHVLEVGGSVSAEHGIGRLKREWLVKQRGEADLSVFRAIKSALDPDHILQPGVLF